ncbi:MAG: STAS domain-containing protein [Stenomitos rutilans HA7619-LM2]|jgi:anti-anti-sigma factor|nr:STAS domain-containing protein [Stenomitos rutilans HA7619-LM2]
MTPDHETLVHQKKVVRLQPPHRLDLMGGVGLQRQIAAIEPEQGSLWLIDMAHVEFIDSAGRLALVKTLSLAQANHCRLLICNLPASIRIIFELTQLDQVFELVDSSTALAGVGLSFSEPPQTAAPIAA